MLRYTVKSHYIDFWCLCTEGNKEASGLLSEFLLELSQERKVFVHAYRLPDCQVPELIEPTVILEKAGRLLDPFHTYFHLSEARINFDCLTNACETYIFFFNKEVEWTDFLATSGLCDPVKYIKNGMLSALFISGDQGADYFLNCSRAFDKRVEKLVEGLVNTGYQIQKPPRRSFSEILRRK